MTPASRSGAAKHRRQIALAVVRPLAITIALVGLYFLLPMDNLAKVPMAVTLLVGLVVLVAVAAGYIRVILRSEHPGMRASEALATVVPLFLLLFASAYFAMSATSPASFSRPLTSTDSLYFTVTVFSTVGFGDILATSQTAELAVTVQMILNLLFLGLGVRVIVGAVQLARQGRPETSPGSATPAPDDPH
jgi:voltage-gated potassium channel